jgi:hypothetical protein
MGAHANSTITIPLKGYYSAFSAVTGLDGEVLNQPGSVTFKVITDGAEVFNSGEMTPGEYQSVNVSLTGKQTLRLTVDGGGMIDHDHADWANAKLTDINGQIVYVSDLGYSETYDYRQAVRNRSIDFGPLTLDGQEYENGLGAHANSAVTVPLNGDYDRFRAIIGIDDEVQASGASVIYKINADNAEIYNSGVMQPAMSNS